MLRRLFCWVFVTVFFLRFGDGINARIRLVGFSQFKGEDAFRKDKNKNKLIYKLLYT